MIISFGNTELNFFYKFLTIIMAAFMVRTCLKQRPSARIWTDIIRFEQNEIQKQYSYTKMCIECHCYHTTSVYLKMRKTREEKKNRANFIYKPKEPVKLPVVDIWKNMTVQELSNSCGRSVSEVLTAISYTDSGKYTKNTAIENRNILFDAVKKLGAKYKIVPRPDQDVEDNSVNCDAVRRPPPDPSMTVKRHPVVTIMGHVDHGKTTLLDSLRHTSVVSTESGGITQHIGAFNVTLDTGEKITFLDTPGHAAFSAMRSRGANATDIVILVVAADDGVMEQTIQSIRMAREANVPIIVAINKIDKPGADIERTKRMLAEQGIHVESCGGEIPSINISALKGLNLNELMETVVAQAEIMNLRGDPKGFVEGVVIEVTTEPGRGKLATALIQRGTLRKGSILVSGLAWAKVRAMFDHVGNPISEAKLSDAVQIIGWRELPSAGDLILEVENERRVNIVLSYRQSQQAKNKAIDALEVIQKKQEEHNLVYKAALLKRKALGRTRRIRKGPRTKEIIDDGIPRVNVVIKGDVVGSVEAILDVFETYGDENRCRLDVVHYGIGPVTENDVELAEAFDGLIYTFHTSVPKSVELIADKLNVPIHHFKVIYKLIDAIKAEICKKLPPGHQEEKIGEANVLQYFQINERRKKVGVAGCRCISGILKKNEMYRILRNEETIYEGKLAAMKHLKEDVNTIKTNIECGLRFQDPDVVVQPGDTIICYTVHEVPPSVNWDPGF